MRVLLALFFAVFASASAFVPIAHKAKVSTTSLTAERRDVISTMAATMFAVTGLPQLANAKPASTFFFEDEKVREPSQQATGGKLDINSAFVVRSLLEPQCSHQCFFVPERFSSLSLYRETTRLFLACSLMLPASSLVMALTRLWRTFTRSKVSLPMTLSCSRNTKSI